MAAKKKTTNETVSSSDKETPVAKKAEKKVAAKKVVSKDTLLQPEKPVELKGFAKKQYQKLLDLRDGLLDAMDGITHETLKNTDGMETGAGGQHTGDAGSDSYDRDFALNLLAKEQDSLSEIEQAITRCKRGVYGICEMSGEKIPKERLEAIPFARYTVKCQASWEQDHNNKGKRQGGSDFSFSSGAMR